MDFNDQFLDLHSKFFTRVHAFPATAIAFLCAMSKEPSRSWKPADFERKFGYTYLSCANTLRRLRLEGFADADGRITAAGLSAAGVPRIE